MSRIREGVLSFVNYVAAILQGGGESPGPGGDPFLRPARTGEVPVHPCGRGVPA